MDTRKQDIVLVHGLWVPGAAMWPLAACFAAAGFVPHVFAYRGRRPLEQTAARLARYVRGRLKGRSACYLGHSLGGVVVLEMLDRFADIPLAAALLVAAPVCGCLAARRLARSALGRRMLGASLELWDENRAARWRRAEPLGVIAGTRPLGLGRLFGPLPGANDGVVRLDETRVEGESARLVLPLAHSQMAVAPSVARAAAQFMRRGGFGA